MQNRWTRWVVVAIPYLWLVVLFLVPFLIVLKISFSMTAVAQPPYTPVIDFANGIAAFSATGTPSARTFRFTAVVQDDDAAQGLSANAGFTWETQA